jgi:hypothetical protein
MSADIGGLSGIVSVGKPLNLRGSMTTKNRNDATAIQTGAAAKNGNPPRLSPAFLFEYENGP